MSIALDNGFRKISGNALEYFYFCAGIFSRKKLPSQKYFPWGGSLVLLLSFYLFA